MSIRQFLLVVGLCLPLAGCGSAPQVAAPNRKLLAALQTAVQAEKVPWLDEVAKQIAEKRQKQELSDAEFTALDGIVKQAKSGDWKGAKSAVFALSEGQQSSPADLERVKNRQLPTPIPHVHKHP